MFVQTIEQLECVPSSYEDSLCRSYSLGRILSLMDAGQFEPPACECLPGRGGVLVLQASLSLYLEAVPVPGS